MTSFPCQTRRSRPSSTPAPAHPSPCAQSFGLSLRKMLACRLYGIPEFLALLDLFLREHVPSAAWPHRGPPLLGRSRLHRPTLVPARAGSRPRDSYPPSEPPSARGSAMHPRLGHLLWPRAAPPAAAHGDSARDLALGAGLCRRAVLRPHRRLRGT